MTIGDSSMRSYWPAIILSVLGHIALIGFIFWGSPADSPKKQVKTPSYVKATLIELAPKVKAKPIVQPKKLSATTKKKDEQRKKALKKKKQQKIAVQKEQKKLAEQKRKSQLAKRKAEKAKEKAKKDQERREAEKRKQEKIKQREQKAESERQALIRALAEERARLNAQQQAAEDAKVVQSYTALIAQRVEKNWRKNVPIRVFEQQFRVLSFSFSPEDLRQ